MTEGMAWHVHHDVLVEFCFSLEERQAYIRADKPMEEQEVRLQRLRWVKGDLPVPVLQANAAVSQAQAALAQAWAAFYQVGPAVSQANAAVSQAGAALAQAWAAEVDQALVAVSQARAALDQARAALAQAKVANMPAIEALHAQECPNCPWTGSSIFPEKEP